MTRIRKPCFVLVLVIALVAALGQTALAHTAGAVVSFDPAVPAAGQTGTVQVKMLDAYGAVIPATVRLSVSAIDEPAPAWLALTQPVPGIHAVQVRFPESVGALLRLEVSLPDGPSVGHLMFRVGEGGFAVQQIPVALMHEDESTDNGKPYGMPAVAPAPAQPGPSQTLPAPAASAARNFPWPLAAVVVALLAMAWVIIRRRQSIKGQP